MSDVDDELLMLAGGGGDSSDDEGHAETTRHRGSDAEDDDAPMNISRRSSIASSTRHASPSGHKSSAQKGVAAKKTPTKRARRRSDESEEEGEASSAPGSPSSLQSAPMDESDSDSDGEVAPKRRGGRDNNAKANDDEDDEENKYPVDGLFMSAQEKAEIMQMREVDREQILAERAQEKDRIHQNKLLRQLVSNDEQRKKRTASAADLDDDDDDEDGRGGGQHGQRKTSRVRTKTGNETAASAMDTLKTRRAEKHERTRRREEDRERRKSHAGSLGGGEGGEGDDDYEPEPSGGGRGRGRDGGDDDDQDSDVEWAKPRSRRVSPATTAAAAAAAEKESQTPQLYDFERIRLSRSRFAAVCFYPGFEDALRGTYVRIAMGPHPETQEQVYRMAVVKGFTKGREYAIQTPQGKSLVTNQYLLAAVGKKEREYPFIACSESAFTESELNRFKVFCHKEGVPIPKKGFMLNKADDINKLLNRSWNEAELTEKVARQQALLNKFNGVNRMKLEYQLREARTDGDVERARELQEELDRHETPRLAFRTTLQQNSLERFDDGGQSQQDRLAELNAENRRRNAETVRRAQLAERAKAREIERKLGRGEAIEEDHSRRLRTRAKFVHDVHNREGEKKKQAASQAQTQTQTQSSSQSQAGSGANTPSNGTPKLLPQLAKLSEQKHKEARKGGLATFHRPVTDDEVIASLDLGIDDLLD